MNTEIYFLRHAHSDFSLENEETRELSAKGWATAKKITDKMIKEDIQYVISSPYVRAIQTVEGLARYLHKEIELDSRFIERDLAARDFYFDKPLEAIKYVFDNPIFRFSGGESNQEVQERGISGLKHIVSKYRRKRVAVGIHGNIMTCTLNYFNKKFDYHFWRDSIDNLSRYYTYI
ncbi:phosphoglycerate mutase family protein [Alkalihalophilus pseudofirmus OF4]|uniref:Phosphoglycerate mutase family protein n=1 Tax=Alkalihalophilus pseudofirmus (strain ATCC BAA-2126 / JCM 17055 / OF4) TaxID=398511 RepID=D3FX54_ALKPO|nr:histidine phosphatase family protein [Alkalihalophilus pseudofirmus]ADC48809.1 phosphoglycerate mutase family protein [Alkalihalophilus pseudofirmus OF4]